MARRAASPQVATAHARALVAYLDALTAEVTARPRRKTFRATVDTLRRVVATLMRVRDDEPAQPIGFTAEQSGELADVEESQFGETEHPDHGMDDDHDHDHDRQRGTER